jgi:hypothetical protein
LVVVIRMSARMASTSRPVASVHQEKRRSTRTPPLLLVRAGRGPPPPPGSSEWSHQLQEAQFLRGGAMCWV